MIWQITVYVYKCDIIIKEKMFEITYTSSVFNARAKYSFDKLHGIIGLEME